jgi:hypothetical protein
MHRQARADDVAGSPSPDRRFAPMIDQLVIDLLSSLEVCERRALNVKLSPPVNAFASPATGAAVAFVTVHAFSQ